MKSVPIHWCERPTLVTERVAQSNLLSLRNVSAGYGAARVLHGLTLDIARGETLVVIGRNGVGKSTLIETIVGLTSLHEGEIHFAGQRVERLQAHARNRLGVGWVPQEREVFRSLTVEENLRVVARKGAWTFERVLALFPRLGERLRNLGSQLSGGEQQMLSMGRALMTNPTLLLLDEPVEGLAPLVVQEMFNAVNLMRKSGDMTILLVEQKYELALAHSDRCIVIDHGAVVHESPSQDLLKDPALIERLIGVAA
jgi:branched-chain amino acid transport system ATP-binding protein